LRADRRLVLVIAGLVAALAFLPGAGARPARTGSYGGVLVVGLTHGFPDSLDPTLNASFSSVQVFRAIALRLYDFDAKGRVYPELASALPTVSADGLTYTIPLRQGVSFNDGTPFNAQAVVVSLDRDMTLPGSNRASNLSPIDSVTTSGPYTAVIHLKQRFTPLIPTLATNVGIVMSPTQLTKLGTNFGSDPIGVGPFMYDSQVTGSSVTVIKSPFFYDQDAVHLNKIVFQNASDPASAVAALQAGDIQMLDAVAPAELPALQNDPAIRLITVHSLGWTGIQINIGNSNGIGNLPYTPVARPLASSALLRRAFEEAIDRPTLVRVVKDGQATPDCLPIPPSSPIYDTTVKCTGYDPRDARKLVAESGIPNPTIQLATTATTVLLAQFIQSEEEAVGINVTITTVDTPTFESLEEKGNFDIVIGSWSGSPAIDQNVFQFLATTGSRNFGGYSNPRLDLILANARKATSNTALRTLWHAGFQIMLADRPIIFLYHTIVTAAVASKVKGVEFLLDTEARVDFAQDS
jgi:peptide/nickel transport system substrate-binding protein